MKKILVVGDTILDHYILGDTSRISPEAPVPVINVRNEEIRPGGAANVAANIAAMGGDVTLMYLGGDDATTGQLTDDLAKYPLKLLRVHHPEFTTTRKTRIVAANQQIVRIDKDCYPSPEQQAKLLDHYRDRVENFDIVVFSDYAKGTLDRLPEFLDVAGDLKKMTLVDPKRSDPNFYRRTTILKPNSREFGLLFGEKLSHLTSLDLLPDLLSKYAIGSMLITRGDKGMVVVGQNQPTVELPTFAREVYDVSGAGDTVLAALSVALSRGRTFLDAATFANVAAGIAVSHRGTYVVTASDLERELVRGGPGSAKLVNLQQLQSILEGLRQKGKKIVFTNGCFDILHSGHVKVLNEARGLGDILVVGLNSDTSVSKLKGPKRPINTLRERAEVLAGLSSVDFVIEFDAPTPYEMIKALSPDVLVKGGDYQTTEIVGHDIVEEAGGKVYSLKFHEGRSTTKIINDIARAQS